MQPINPGTVTVEVLHLECTRLSLQKPAAQFICNCSIIAHIDHGKSTPAA